MRVFAHACAVLAGRTGRPTVEGIHGPAADDERAQANALLHNLGYDADAPGPVLDNRLALLALAGRVPELFRLAAVDAPGLVLLGARFNPTDFGLPEPDGAPISASGRGMDFAQAFESCMGEVAEYLSFLPWPADPITDAQTPPVLDALAGPRRTASPCLAGRSLHETIEVGVPPALCIRYKAGAAGSNGLAAGASGAAATYAAIMELVERDAVALWWYGGAPARPLAVQAPDAEHLAHLAQQLRRSTDRPHWLVDVTTDLAIPVVVAISHDRHGRNLCFGYGADLDPLRAAGSALTELCQMEVARHLLSARLEHDGEDTLSRTERDQLARLRLDLHDHPWLRPDGLAAVPPHARGEQATVDERLAHALAILRAAALPVYAVDLTRESLGIAVSRVIIPGLQGPSPEPVSPRLRRCLERYEARAEKRRQLPPFV